MPLTQDEIDAMFACHATTPEGCERYAIVGHHARLLARVMVRHSPPGPVQRAALGKLCEAVRMIGEEAV